jgi:hypothetical protein
MPLIFSTEDYEEVTSQYVTRGSLPLDTARNNVFRILTDNRGDGQCVHCENTANGRAWGGSSWVMCAACAVEHHGAYDLRLGLPEEQEIEITDDSPVVTKRDKNFTPGNYCRQTYHRELKGRNGCAGYRCPTYPAPDRAIPANTPFMAYSNSYLCMPCFETLKAKWESQPRAECGYCARFVLSRSLTQTLRYGMVCQSCIGDFTNCPYTDGGYVCQNSLTSCRTTLPGRLVAERVYASLEYATAHWFDVNDTWYATREEADAMLFTSDPMYIQDRINRHRGYHVFSYGTNVIKMLGFPKVTSKDALCFGVELEMLPKNGISQEAVVETLGGKWVAERPYILCRDGSLGDSGVEMITLPYTLNVHKSDKQMPWKKVLADLRHVAMSGKITQACGMHVHINRRALSNLQMGKMLVAINAPEMQQLVCCVAQRNDSGYSHRKFFKVSDGKKIEGAHFDALNIATNKGTCELRIFRGNLRYERVMKNLEFAEALCMYASEASIRDMSDPNRMISWISDNRAHYPYLERFIRETYKHSEAVAFYAKNARASQAWTAVCSNVLVEETEGDI